MNPPSQLIFQWPELPPLPPVGQPVLIRVVTPVARPAARQELRAALRQVLTTWSGLALEQLPLGESPRGPQWQGLLAGHPLDFSLSYCDGEGWIGLIRSGAIGVDAMSVQPIAEAEAVARHYLGLNALVSIRQSCQPAQAFALAWTELEARLKCLKLELTEWNANRTATSANYSSREIFFDHRTAIAVVTSG
jgi:hypothetical protein